MVEGHNIIVEIVYIIEAYINNQWDTSKDYIVCNLMGGINHMDLLVNTSNIILSLRFPFIPSENLLILIHLNRSMLNYSQLSNCY